jgi:site-specific recombinase XerD
MTGTVVRVKGIKRYFEPKTGRTYCYHRATGVRVSEEFGSAAFFKRLADLDSRSPTAGQAREAKAGSLRALIIAYKADEAFTGLAPRTKSDYEKTFAWYEPVWDQPLELFSHEEIVRLIDKWKRARGRRFVNMCITTLRLLFAFARYRCLIAKNPMLEVGSLRRQKRAEQWNRPWTNAERTAAWERTARPRWAHLRLPMALALFAGLREGDMVALPKSAVLASQVSHKTAKRGVWIDLSVQPELARAIAEAAPHDAPTLCANSRGRSWTESGFRASWNHMIAELEAEGLIEDGCTFHGLRHSLAHTIAEHEDGFDDTDIASVLGQRTAGSAKAYTQRANRARRAKAVLAKVSPLRPGK